MTRDRRLEKLVAAEARRGPWTRLRPFIEDMPGLADRLEASDFAEVTDAELEALEIRVMELARAAAEAGAT
jgi:hypothetical protein